MAICLLEPYSQFRNIDPHYFGATGIISFSKNSAA